MKLLQSLFAILFVFQLFQLQITCIESEYTFVVLSDMHIGESEEQTQLAQDAIAKINSMVSSNNIKFVLITGDISNTALPKQFEDAKSILDTLTVPYIPIIGNHDIWTYNSSSNWEETEPHGDELFYSIFYPTIASFPSSLGEIKYNNKTTWNPELNITSHFQNFQLTLTDDNSGNITVIYGLDWSTRYHAIEFLGYLGAMPGCRLHNFLGGTFQWLEDQLYLLSDNSTSSLDRNNNKLNKLNNKLNNNNQLNNNEEEISDHFDNEKVVQIITMQHQPYELPIIVPGFVYAFGEPEKKEIRNLLARYFPVEKYWGVIAGHMHIWWNGTAFPLSSSPSSFLPSSILENNFDQVENDVSIDDKKYLQEFKERGERDVNWESFWQWETCACKRSAAFSLVSMVNSKIAGITKHYGDSQLHSDNKYLCGEKVPSAADSEHVDDFNVDDTLFHTLC